MEKEVYFEQGVKAAMDGRSHRDNPYKGHGLENYNLTGRKEWFSGYYRVIFAIERGAKHLRHAA